MWMQAAKGDRRYRTQIRPESQTLRRAEDSRRRRRLQNPGQLGGGERFGRPVWRFPAIDGPDDIGEGNLLSSGSSRASPLFPAPKFSSLPPPHRSRIHGDIDMEHRRGRAPVFFPQFTESGGTWRWGWSIGHVKALIKFTGKLNLTLLYFHFYFYFVCRHAFTYANCVVYLVSLNWINIHAWFIYFMTHVYVIYLHSLNLIHPIWVLINLNLSDPPFGLN